MILVTGGTGFVGRHVVRELERLGHPVRVLARSRDKADRSLKGTRAEVVIGDLFDTASLDAACQGCHAVVHLVGIIFEKGASTFERVHVQGTRHVVEAARRAGIERFVHMSAIGTRPLSPSRYHTTKWQAEEVVRESGLLWTLFRPSVIYGPKDQFVQLFSMLMDPPLSWMALNIMPCPYEGKSLMQPVTVDAVAAAFARAVGRPVTVGKVYDLCGPPIRLMDMLARLAEAKGLNPIESHAFLPALPFVLPYYALQGRHPVLVKVPGELVRILAWFIEHFSPVAWMNSDQMLMLQEDQRGDAQPALIDLDVAVPPFEQGIAFLEN
ncbi:MAG: SDR family oxidoreductase [Candidatus Methylacidiphilales bacterium]